MSPAHQTETVPFEAPDAGSWELDLAHFSPDCARLVRDAMEVGMKEGMAVGFELVGAPVRTIEARFINGRFYRRLVPLVGASRNLPPPPDLVLKIATRVVPVFRRRSKTAAAALDGRIWLDELRQWEEQWKPDLISTSRRLAAVDPASLSDAELASHIEAANTHLIRSLVLHFRLHISDLGPIGLLLVHGRDWGLGSPDLMQCLSGYSAATSAPAHALRHLRSLLPAPPASLEDVRSAGPEAADALDDFLTEYGNRLTGGYDLGDLTLGEMPDTIVAGIRAAGEAPIDCEAKALGDHMAATLRDQVPESDRSTFDRLIEDARALYGLRDENGPITYEWPAGVMRQIQLHSGERLAASGRLPNAKHVFDLSASELSGLLRREPNPTAAEIDRRFNTRQHWTTLEPPRLLGPEPVLPPIEIFPGPLARLMDATLTVMELIESPITRSGLTGAGIGEDSYVGRARVVSDAIDALASFQPGDVLVAPFTVPTINSVLAMAGALVTEEGGLLSHAAVIAREFGIPGVIGAAGAVAMIPDGATVRVDAASVTVV